MSGRPNKIKPVPVKSDLIVPPPPESLDEIAVVEWHRVSQKLFELGVLSDLDVSVIAGYCEAWSEFVRLSLMVKKVGPVTKTDKGNWIQHPVLGVKNHAAERMLRFAAQLGITPVAREKLNIKPVESDDSFAKFAGLKVMK